MSNVLVTGGAGLIGSYVCRELLNVKKVDHVIVLDNFGRHADPTKGEAVDYRKERFMDIRDKVIMERGPVHYYGILDRLLHKYEPEYVIHLASLPLAKIDNLNVQEAQEGTVLSTSNIMEIIGTMQSQSTYRLKRFLYTSSSMVYGDWQREMADESHPTNPKDIYGAMKLAGEVVTRGLGTYFHIPWTIIRPSAVYGPTDMNNRVSQIFIEKAFRNETIVIRGADEKLDFSYVSDVARGFVLAMLSDSGENEVFNITGGHAYSLVEFVEILRDNFFPELKFEITERESFRPRRGTLDISKARKFLNYAPEYDLKKGIFQYVEFIRRSNEDSTVTTDI